MKYLLAAVLLLALFFIVIMVYDVNRFVIPRYQITSAKLKKPYRFVVL